MYKIASLKKYPGMATFGEKLRALRELKKLDQRSMAAAINKKYPDAALNDSAFKNWENDRHLPSMPKAIAVCNYFKVTLDDMFRANVTVKKLLGNKQKNRAKA